MTAASKPTSLFSAALAAGFYLAFMAAKHNPQFGPIIPAKEAI